MDRSLLSYKLPADVVLAWRAYVMSLNSARLKEITGDWHIKKKVGSPKHGDVVLEHIIREYLEKEGIKV